MSTAIESLLSELKEFIEHHRFAHGYGFQLMSVIEALGETGDPRAVEPLMETIDSAGYEPNIEQAVKKALRKIHRASGARGVEPLVAALRKKGSRKKAFQALRATDWQPANDTERAWFILAKAVSFPYREAKDWKELGRLGAAAIEPLKLALEDYKDDLLTRDYAMSALGEIKDASSVEVLIRKLSDEDDGARLQAAKLLADIGDARAEASLVAALADENSLIRHYAIKALGKIGSPLSVDSLISILKRDEDPEARFSAALALGESGDKRAAAQLIDSLKDEGVYVYRSPSNSYGGDWVGNSMTEPTPDAIRRKYVRAAAAYALGKIRDAQSIEHLGRVANRDPISEVREAARVSLKRIAPQALVSQSSR